jgi:hypothetical protein
MLKNFPNLGNNREKSFPRREESTALFIPVESLPGEAGRWLRWSLDKTRMGNRNDMAGAMARQLRDNRVPFSEAEEAMYAFVMAVTDVTAPFTLDEGMAYLRWHYATEPREATPHVSLWVSGIEVTNVASKDTLVGRPTAHMYSGNSIQVSQPTMYSGSNSFVKAAVAADNMVQPTASRKGMRGGSQPNPRTLARVTAILELWSSLYSQKPPRVQRIQEWLNMVAASSGGRYAGHEAEALARFILDLDSVHHSRMAAITSQNSRSGVVHHCGQEETPAAYVEKSLCVECGVPYREKPKKKPGGEIHHQDPQQDMPFSLAGVA